MHTDRPELVLRDPMESHRELELEHAQDRAGKGPALLDVRDLESLLLNLDASLRVHARTHFFSWTQGLLQSLVRHKVLICGLRAGDPTTFRVDSFSTLVPDATALGELMLRDPSVAPGLIKIWKEHKYLPMLCPADDLSTLLGGPFTRELERIEATHLALHGSPAADGEANSFFVFACESDAGPNQAYVLELVVPFLHAAWVRSQTHESAQRACGRVVSTGVLTAREREILRWIYLGKSNSEVGAILEISPLTVKNHVQKILRKLNVVNRAQAVGKALDARLIGP
jgi:transcriptional regulator EpsA